MNPNRLHQYTEDYSISKSNDRRHTGNSSWAFGLFFFNICWKNHSSFFFLKFSANRFATTLIAISVSIKRSSAFVSSHLAISDLFSIAITTLSKYISIFLSAFYKTFSGDCLKTFYSSKPAFLLFRIRETTNRTAARPIIAARPIYGPQLLSWKVASTVLSSPKSTRFQVSVLPSSEIS